jgi:hypothetical protein
MGEAKLGVNAQWILVKKSMSALPIIAKQNSPSVGLFTH